MAGASVPVIASCASDITKLSERPVAGLASELGVCSAAYAVVRSGKPMDPVAVTGCGNDTDRADAIFQAASLTKPVVAFAALRLALEGELDLDAPASHYLPNGYTHFHSVLARSPSEARDLMP